MSLLEYREKGGPEHRITVLADHKWMIDLPLEIHSPESASYALNILFKAQVITDAKMGNYFFAWHKS